jgi:hypothetical protein
MRFVTAALTVVAACASAAVAVAAPVRLSDVQFIAANRCLGIESTKAFATPDTDALRKLVKDNWGRDSYIQDKADEARQDGERDASRAGAETTTRITAERDGVCRALVSTTTTASTPSGAHNMMQ